MPNYVKYNGNNLLFGNEKVLTSEIVAEGGAYTAPSNLISFSIDSTEYQAEEGMTFADWIESDYNTGGFVAYDGGVFTSDNSYYIDGVSLTDVISDGGEYGLTQY